MKKFFSLLCATLLVFSASAAQMAPKAELAKKAPVAVKQMQKVPFEKAQFAKTASLENIQLSNQLSATPALKVSNQKAQAPMARRQSKATKEFRDKVTIKPAVHKAPNAVAEDINVTAESVYFDGYYSEYDMYTADGFYAFSGFASTPTVGQTYTLDNMYAPGTGFYTWEYDFTPATAATLKVDTKNGLPYVVGTMTIGGNNYTITYELVITDTVTVKANNLAVNSHYYGGYNYLFNDAAWTFDIVDFDMTSKTGTLTNIDFDYSCVYPTGGSAYYDGIYFAAVTEDVVVVQDADTMKLTGAIAAENGILYVLDARYEKPAPVEITLVADTLNFFTKMLNAGYYTMDGYNEDSTYKFSFYFLSKSLTGFFTEEDMDPYSTWVDEKDGKTTVVSYQNLSEANIYVYLKNDTLYYTGTMTLATNDGQEAEITLNLSCPYAQVWGEWEDFAPLGFNTGKYILDIFGKNLRNIPVQVRKANIGLKQYKLAGWGAGYFCEKGADLIIEVDGKNVCTIAPTNTGYAEDPYFAITDYDTWNGTYGASTFDPETYTFNFTAVWYNASTFKGLSMSHDSFVMDQPITERDTVKVNLNGFIIEKDIDEETGDFLGWLYIGEDTDTTYLVQVVGAEKYGTFSYADSTLGDYYFNIIPSSEEGKAIPFYEGEVTIVEDEEGIKLTGLMTGDDEKAYVLNWILPAGVIMYDTDEPFVGDFAWKDMSTSLKEGVATISIYNGEKAVGLELYCDPAATKIPAGVYTISDTQEAATALQSIGFDEEGYLQPCFAVSYDADGDLDKIWFLVEGTVSLSYDDYGKLNVEVNAKNSYGQDVIVNVTYEKIEPKNTVMVADAEFYIYEGLMEEYDIVNFYGGNEEFEFDLYAFAETVSGDFINAIDFLDCGLYLADGTELSIIDAYEFKVEADGKNLTLTAKVLGSDTIQYNITATGYYGALFYDTNDDYEGVYEFEDVVFDQEAVDDANYIIIQGENEAGDYFALAIEGKLTDEGAIAAGEYTEVWASFGLDEEYNPSISFVWVAEDYLWFIQSGKLTVYENGAMFFEGLNSLDKNVTITVNEEPSALINTKATMKAVKALKNGMIVIKKNGKAYNVLGIAL